MRHIKLFIVTCLVGMLSSCSAYLDIVPDDIATIDNAFSMRAQAEKYLFTCYYYLPSHGVVEFNPALTGGDELYVTEYFRSAAHVHSWYIAHGMQSATNPRCDYWRGSAGTANGSKDLYQGISDCNIFLENIHRVPDMTQAEKDRWRAEVKFLKAYYHYWLIRMYGPIPLMDKNTSVDADAEEVKTHRATLDECFAYVVKQLDEVIDSRHLPDKITNEAEELGRITQGIALSIKAEMLLTAASPLFNGNTDYRGYTDNRGVEIFCPNKTDEEKKQRWVDAAEACRLAIDFLHEQGHRLYKYTSLEYNISDETRAKMNIRNAVTEKWNEEIIWANTNSITGQLQDHAIPRGLESGKEGNASVGGNLAVPLKITDLFYTKNGVPITEDKDWDYSERFKLRKATANEKYFIKEGYTTANINFDREVRYYASLGFDGSVWFGQGVTDETKPIYVQSKQGQSAANQISNSWNETGIWPKKLVHFKSVVGQTSGFTKIQYPFPVMRLSNLYLMYAEALNESGASQGDVLTWVDYVRDRAGLNRVEESWNAHTTNKKYQTIDGRRDIIHQERGIELAFEAQRFWDLRRWKRAYAEQNKPITGWNTQYSTNEEYYNERLIYKQEFKTKDYFWPIYDKEIYSNKNLVQNYGW